MTKVLIADDEREVSDFLAEALSERYSLSVAYDGEQALTALTVTDPDVVILDVRMPKLDGIAVAEQDIRRMKGAARRGYILISAYLDRGALERWLALFDEPLFFSKPVALETLIRAIDSFRDGV